MCFDQDAKVFQILHESVLTEFASHIFDAAAFRSHSLFLLSKKSTALNPYTAKTAATRRQSIRNIRKKHQSMTTQ